MVTFLFWNLKKRPLHKNIRRLVSVHEIDVLMFAEFSAEPVLLLKTLNRKDTSEFCHASGICRKIEIFTRFSKKFISPVYENDRLTIRHLNLQDMTDILLAVGHFPSKTYQSDMSQAFECSELSREIRQAEHEIGYSRTVMVGDFNMNPFEDGIVSANGFNAVMTRDIAGRRFRTVQNRKYPFFYNPMWNFFGDASPGRPPGTYYHSSSEHRNFFWNIFDQVLIRPDLTDSFSNEELKILESDGKTSFMTPYGIPDDRAVSDHLPILFRLRL